MQHIFLRKREANATIALGIILIAGNILKHYLTHYMFLLAIILVIVLTVIFIDYVPLEQKIPVWLHLIILIVLIFFLNKMNVYFLAHPVKPWI